MNWIWCKEQEKNTFAEFQRSFVYQGGQAELFISADFKYAAYLNGKMVSCGQYADYPDYKVVNKVDITAALQRGENVLQVVAWHMGEDCSVSRTMTPALGYEIVVDGQTLVKADKNTLCRVSAKYNRSCLVTRQLGYGFAYDFTAKDKKWKKSREIQPNFTEVPRPIQQTTVDELCVSKIVAQGIFKYQKQFKKGSVALQMQNAWLSTLRFEEMTGEKRLKRDTLIEPLTFKAKGGNGVFVVADMGRETCGYLGFTVKVSKPCKMILGWGEHLADLRVRTEREARNFAMQFSLKAGENALDDYLLRIGCRYICIFVEGEEVEVARLGIREVNYPFNEKKKDFGDKLLNAIYETGRRTLRLSAHEHYEDCPWREQALYGMDSRNQMLFGYGAFEEYEYPRANLRILARSMQEDGLVALTPPADMPICIPSFTSYWLIAIGENADADYNEEFAKEILPYAERALEAFFARKTEEGICLLTEPRYWNFHEWSDGLDGGEIFRDYVVESEGDLGLTALTVVAAKRIAALEEKVGNVAKAEELYTAARELAVAMEKYYDGEKGLYASYLKKGEKRGYHAYTQSLVLFTGETPADRIQTLCAALKAPEEYGLVPETFAALQLKYEALLKYGNELDYVLDDVVKIFSKMLFSGATSYWETEYGEADFDDAGSLCHGWSSVACWVFDTFLKKE